MKVSKSGTSPLVGLNDKYLIMPHKPSRPLRKSTPCKHTTNRFPSFKLNITFFRQRSEFDLLEKIRLIWDAYAHLLWWFCRMVGFMRIVWTRLSSLTDKKKRMPFLRHPLSLEFKIILLAKDAISWLRLIHFKWIIVQKMRCTIEYFIGTCRWSWFQSQGNFVVQSYVFDDWRLVYSLADFYICCHIFFNYALWITNYELLLKLEEFLKLYFFLNSVRSLFNNS